MSAAIDRGGPWFGNWRKCAGSPVARRTVGGRFPRIPCGAHKPTSYTARVLDETLPWGRISRQGEVVPAFHADAFVKEPTVCGIAGIIDVRGQWPVNLETLGQMTRSLFHRGPDEEGFYVEPGVGLASRRLSIVGLADGQQPIFNEDGSVVVVANGEFFDYPEVRAELIAKGHTFQTHSDTENLVHLWEEYGEGLFEHLRGQFAFALLDRRRRVLILARDRVGICPLHVARRDDLFLFASEIKALLASGYVEAKADLRGLDHVFTFFAMGTKRTAFEGVSSLLPGTYLRIQFRESGGADISERRYWDLDFPDRGEEYDPSAERAIDELREVFFESVRLRLRADVPVVSYLSGGVDSATIGAAITQVRGECVPTFTIQIADPSLDETTPAQAAARAIGTSPILVPVGNAKVTETYPRLIEAADSPVVDTSCAAKLCLAQAVHDHGYRVALTGEGADEALAGYPWYKANRLLGMLDGGSYVVTTALRRAYLKLFRPDVPWSRARRVMASIGGPAAYNDLYAMTSLSRHIFYRPETFQAMDGFVAYDDLDFPLERIRRWHPLNKALYLGYKVMLCGLLLNQKGDRPAMHCSVENRHPFLDERFIDYCSRLHPRWKIRGLMQDKYLLRQFATKLLPKEVAGRPKGIFQAPFAPSFFTDPPAYVEQLLSHESLEKTGYFDADAVHQHRQTYHHSKWGTGRRLTIEMGLSAVMATQLWHHIYLGGGLCELATFSPPQVDVSRLNLRRPPAETLLLGR